MIKDLFGRFERLVSIRDHDLSLQSDSGAFRVLWTFLKPFKWVIVASAVTGMILTGFELAKLWAVSHLVDVVAYSRTMELSPDNLMRFGVLILAYALLDPLIWLVNYMLRLQSLKSQTKASSLWQSHKAAARHDMSYFNAMHAGQVAGRINQISTAVQSGAELLAGRFPMGFIRFIGSAVLISYLAPLFLVPVLVWIVLNGVFAIWLAPKVNVQAQKISETASIVNGTVTEYFSNIRAIKTSFAYRSENDFVYASIEKQNFNSMQINRLTTITGLLIRVLNTGLVATILALGVYGLSVQSVSPGEFVAGVTLASGMAADAGWFVSIWEGLTQSLGAIRDVRPTIDPRPKIIAPVDDVGRFEKPPVIELSKVAFAYENGSLTILRDIQLKIQPGQKVGIVGPSGAGKSTLIDLLLRLYDVSSGEIMFDGVNIKEIPLAKLRSSFAVVSQSDSLFHRSIKDNIAFGVKEFSFQDVVNAASMSDAKGFIDGLSSDGKQSGYHVIVGDRGAKLSGGQQQRILLARAFMQKRPILILDEATSALDSNSETLIQQAIASFSKNTTVIAVAHRLSTIRDFDRIVVLDAGRISAVGTHDDLLRDNPLYRDLWEKQAGQTTPHQFGHMD